MIKRVIVFLLFCFSLFCQENAHDGIEINSDSNLPNSIDDFNPVFYFPPINQDTTQSCWSFSTISFIESEMQRLGKDTVKLSVMYPVYFGFIEKAKYYIETQGKSKFSAGDLFGTVINVFKKYGIVPENVYRGNNTNSKTYNHTTLYKELYSYMENVKKDSLWKEDIVVNRVKEILNNHLGEPPQNFIFKNNEYTPLEFANEIVNIQWEDYIKIMSFNRSPFFKFTSLNVPDNWLPDSSYFNIPLDTFYEAILHSIKNNYSLAIDGDMTEPGRIGIEDICVIPEYDIPLDAINQDAREYRFEKNLTTDDHLMHIIGYQKFNGEDWFLVKDSWRDAFEGKNKGYFFFSEAYVKLKVLAFLVHKEIISDILTNIQKY
jgi:bleomycin hydrolase